MENTTYVLLAAIDDYNEVPKLKGCVNDIEKVEGYLLRNIAKCSVRKLTNSVATKQAIVNEFHELGGKLAAGDNMLFYFCGHGAQEEAHPVWNETDRALECIVCYDDNPRRPGTYLLADKEFRYLIHKLSSTSCHLVTIFDCCHSGDNTRGGEFVNSALNGEELVERRVHYHFPIREWQSFIFHSDVTERDVATRGVDGCLPLGQHVQISACESNEVAVEVNGEGVFTNALIKVLEFAGGNISYFAIRSRIRQYLRFVYEQQPRIFTTGATIEERQHLLYTNFLNANIVEEPSILSEAVYNSKGGWILNVGALHGVDKKTKISLASPVAPGRTYSATVDEVFIDHTSLTIEENSAVDKDTILKAKVLGLQLCELKLHLKSHSGNPKQLKLIVDELVANRLGHFVLTDEESSSDYTLHVEANKIYITHPEDQFRPLTTQICVNEHDIFDENSRKDVIRQLSQMLGHISKWNYIKSLQNKQQGLSVMDNPIKVDIRQVLHDGSEIYIPIKNSGADIKFYNNGGDYRNGLRIRLTNQSGQQLFIAVAYLSYNFQSAIHLLERKVELLDTGDSVSLVVRSKTGVQTDLINLSIPGVIREYNWPGYAESIKVISSAREFDPEALALPPLPSPYTVKGGERERPDFRSFDVEEHPVDFSDWLTQTIHLRYSNPFFNQIDRSKVSQMLAWEKTAFFAQQLYGDLIAQES